MRMAMVFFAETEKMMGHFVIIGRVEREFLY